MNVANQTARAEAEERMDAAVTLACEGLAACTCGWDAWTKLAAQSFAFYDPLRLFGAQMEFCAHMADLGAEAVAERLRADGLDRPLLNDA